MSIRNRIYVVALPLGLLSASCAAQQPRAEAPAIPAESQGRLAPASGTAVERTAPPGTPQPATDQDTPEPAPDDAASAATPLTTLSDPQIAGVLGAIDTSEVNLGKAAEKKAKNPKVKRFAQMMITDHSHAQDKVDALSGKLGLSPARSKLMDSMKSDAETTAQNLAQLKGTNFDMAYMDDQVRGHQKVLDLIDSKLIPQATSPKLKSLITDLRTVIQRHLDKAKDVRTALTNAWK